MAQTQHPKNQGSDEPNTRNLVKPGSTMDPKGSGQPPAQQGGPYGQQPMQVQTQGEESREQSRQRQQEAWDEASRRSKDNNPATQKMRQYDPHAPGMDPANQPDPDTKLYKATRLDLEDVTGNPGHRGVNPDAPANSINGPGFDRTGRMESINEPSHIDQNRPTPEQRAEMAGGSPYSINEPPGSQVIPPGAGAGTGEQVEHGPGSQPPGVTGGQPEQGEAPTIDELVPDEAEVGSAEVTMEVHGTGFTEQSVIQFGPDNDLETTFISEGELTARINPAEWGDGVIEVRVKNADGGLKSEPVEFEFIEQAAPASRQTKRTKPKPQGKKGKR